MRQQSAQYVMRILPDGLGHDQLGFRVDVGKDLDAVVLRVDEAVSFFRIVRMRTYHFIPGRAEGFSERFFHRLLGGPALPIGCQPQISVGYKQHLTLADSVRLAQDRNAILRHDLALRIYCLLLRTTLVSTPAMPPSQHTAAECPPY
jgi:hypothetical protein